MHVYIPANCHSITLVISYLYVIRTIVFLFTHMYFMNKEIISSSCVSVWNGKGLSLMMLGHSGCQASASGG